jgi:hypothetical protein
MKSNSVAPALGKADLDLLDAHLEQQVEEARFFSPSIGSISAWLPSRMSVESQRGGLVIVRLGHCRSGRSTWGKDGI